jgi:uncharacterized protein YdaU (DUF1376 family)
MTLPYFPFYTQAWKDGTRKLTPEQRGIYVDLLTYIYDADGPIEDDLRDLANLLRVDLRVWKRVRSELIALGKIEASEGYLSNGRAASELDVRRSYVETKRQNRSHPNKKQGTENTPDTTGGRETTNRQSYDCLREGDSVESPQKETKQNNTNTSPAAESGGNVVLLSVGFFDECKARIPEAIRGTFTSPKSKDAFNRLSRAYSREDLFRLIDFVSDMYAPKGKPINSFTLFELNAENCFGAPMEAAPEPPAAPKKRIQPIENDDGSVTYRVLDAQTGELIREFRKEAEVANAG